MVDSPSTGSFTSSYAQPPRQLASHPGRLERAQCHSVYEHDAVAWWPLNRSTAASVITGGRSPDDCNAWIHLAPLLARELWRCRGEL